MTVATSSIINWKLKILVIKNRTKHSSSGSKIETVQQLNSYRISTKQVNSYKAWTSPSNKDCREIVVETRNMELSLKKASKRKKLWRKNSVLNLRNNLP